MYAVDAESEVQMCGGGNRHVGIHRSEGAGKCRIACLKHRAKPSQEFQSLLVGLISPLPGSSPRMQLLSSSCSFLLLSSKKRERLWRHRIDARRRDIISNNTRCPLPQHKIPLPPSIYLAIIIHCVEQHKTNFEQHKAGPTRFLTLTFQTFLCDLLLPFIIHKDPLFNFQLLHLLTFLAQTKMPRKLHHANDAPVVKTALEKFFKSK